MDKDNLERLSEELIGVSILKIKTTTPYHKKEELLQKVLKLGGDKYTFEGLRRDLLSFEEENKTKKDNMIDNRACDAEDRDIMEHQCIAIEI